MIIIKDVSIYEEIFGAVDGEVEDLKEDRNFKGAKTSRQEHVEKAVDLLEDVRKDLS